MASPPARAWAWAALIACVLAALLAPPAQGTRFRTLVDATNVHSVKLTPGVVSATSAVNAESPPTLDFRLGLEANRYQNGMNGVASIAGPKVSPADLASPFSLGNVASRSGSDWNNPLVLELEEVTLTPSVRSHFTVCRVSLMLPEPPSKTSGFRQTFVFTGRQLLDNPSAVVPGATSTKRGANNYMEFDFETGDSNCTAVESWDVTIQRAIESGVINLCDQCAGGGFAAIPSGRCGHHKPNYECGAGTFADCSNLPTPMNCAACTANHFCPLMFNGTDNFVPRPCSSPSCSPGQAASQCAATADSTCQGCPPNFFCTGGVAGPATCSNTPCVAGEFFTMCSSSADSQCTACPANNFCVGGTAVAAPCTNAPCPAGQGFTVCNATADSRCDACPANSFCTGGTASAIVCSAPNCALGTFRTQCSATTDATCATCPSGSFCLGDAFPPTICRDCATLNLQESSPCSAIANTVCLDMEPPTLTLRNCPGKPDVNCTWEAGDAFAFSGSPDGFVVSDNVNPNPNVTVVPPEPDVGTVGVYTLVYTASDGSASSPDTVMRRVVTVQDTTRPTITFRPTLNLVVEAGQPLAYASNTFITFADNVNSDTELRATLVLGGDSAALDTALSTPSTGTFSISYTITDGVGLDSQAMRTVMVQDTTAPSIVLRGAATLELPLLPPGGPATNFPDPGVDISDIVDAVEQLQLGIVITPPFDQRTAGIYTVRYTVVDTSVNVNTADRTVEVTDRTDPVIPPQPAVVTIEANRVFSVYSQAPVMATDDVDGQVAVTVQAVGPSNQAPSPVSSIVDNRDVGSVYTVTFTATDSSGNVATLMQTIRVVDSRAPVITLSGAPVISLAEGEEYLELGVTAVDDVDGDVSSTVTATPPGPYASQAEAGASFDITYAVTDQAGNMVTFKRSIMYTAGSGGGSSGGGGGIIFGAVGAILGLILLVLLVLFLLKRRKNNAGIQPKVTSMPMTGVSSGRNRGGPVPAASAPIDARADVVETNVRSVAWYHGFLSAGEAEKKLRAGGPGSFLVRVKPDTEDDLVLSIGTDGKAVHYGVSINENNEYVVNHRACSDLGSNLNSIIDNLKINKAHLEHGPVTPVESSNKIGLAEARGGMHYVRFMRKPRTLSPRIGLFVKATTRSQGVVFTEIDRGVKLHTVPLYYPVYRPRHPRTNAPANQTPNFARVASHKFETYVQLHASARPPHDLLLYSKVLAGGALTFVPITHQEGMSLYEPVIGNGSGAGPAAAGAAASSSSDADGAYASVEATTRPSLGDEAASPQVLSLYSTVNKPRKKGESLGDEVPADPSVLNLYQTVRKPGKKGRPGAAAAAGGDAGAAAAVVMVESSLYDAIDDEGQYENEGASENVYAAVQQTPRPNADGLVYASLALDKPSGGTLKAPDKPTIYAAIATDEATSA